MGMVITGGIVFATGQYNASEVRYDTTSVAGALDNLYNYAKNKSDIAEKMMKPNTWEAGVEQDFGNGVYGKRFTGTITADANAEAWIGLSGRIPKINILSSGGYYTKLQNGVYRQYSVNAYRQYQWSEICFYPNTDDTSTGTLCFSSTANTARTDAPYDVWVLYTR